MELYDPYKKSPSTHDILHERSIYPDYELKYVDLLKEQDKG